MQMLPPRLNRQDFPQLNQLLWDNHNEEILPQEALHYYETRWRYIDENNLQKNEVDLLNLLIKHYGNGLFLTA